MMPRKSLKKLRSEEILNAYADCIVRFGLQGATQQRIAEAAGVHRSILRHYLGNRDEMLHRLVAYIENQFISETDELFAALPDQNRIAKLLNLLFDSRYATNTQSTMAVQALTNATELHPEISEKMLSVTTYLLNALQSELKQAFPTTSQADTFDVALGIVGIYFTIDSMALFKIDETWWQASRRAAQRLVYSLDE